LLDAVLIEYVLYKDMFIFVAVDRARKRRIYVETREKKKINETCDSSGFYNYAVDNSVYRLWTKGVKS